MDCVAPRPRPCATERFLSGSRSRGKMRLSAFRTFGGMNMLGGFTRAIRWERSVWLLGAVALAMGCSSKNYSDDDDNGGDGGGGQSGETASGGTTSKGGSVSN